MTVTWPFPQDVDGGASSQASDVTTHNVVLGNTVRAGYLLLAAASFDGNPTVSGWPAGWQSLVSTTNGTACKLEMRYKVADGTETNFSLTTDVAEQSVTLCRIIVGHSASINPPEVSTPTTGTSTTPDAGSLTPSGGADDYLWYHWHAADGNGISVSNPSPANFPIGNQFQSSGAGNPCMIACSNRRINATSLDPGAGLMSLNEEWIAVTVAVYPGNEGFDNGPYVEDFSTSVTSTANTSHTVTLPSAIPDGRRLIALFVADGNPSITWPGDWNTISGLADTNSGAQVKLSVREKIASSEGASITITTGSSVEAAHQVFSIAAHDPAVAATGNTSTGTGTSITAPTSLSAGTSKAYLILNFFGADDDDEQTVFWAVNTGIEVTQNESSQTATSCMAGSHFRNLFFSTIPGNFFTLAASEEWVNSVLYITPLASSTPDPALATFNGIGPALSFNMTPGPAVLNAVGVSLFAGTEFTVFVESADVVANDMVSLKFGQLMKNNDLLSSTESYSVTDGNNTILVKNVITGSASYTDIIYLQINKFQVGATYTITANASLSDTTGSQLDPERNFAQFVGRETKIDNYLVSAPDMYSKDPTSVIRSVISAILIEDDKIGGNRNDRLN